MSRKAVNHSIIILLIVSSLLLLMGGVMLVKNLSVYGINRRTLMVSGYGGHLLILIGIISLIVTYYSLSPTGCSIHYTIPPLKSYSFLCHLQWLAQELLGKQIVRNIDHCLAEV